MLSRNFSTRKTSLVAARLSAGHHHLYLVVTASTLRRSYSADSLANSFNSGTDSLNNGIPNK